ncbi:DUF3054 domain-containing protein [Actinomyces viscosus]|uniref:DUF3054 domain-containing protein n=1 Tax=Actinomyces viscosus TaxID=1656 RepID=A0A448PHU2_ACTVI|nr:DUF3054 domain-containing protein [Actinomyces viscosus]VEI14453.1 Uncharacterised protein [Actinomyces viscosus]
MSTDGHDRPSRPRTISFTPALPDGADCPWTRDRRTRWWLVVPADLAAVALVALFGAASTRAMGQVVTALWQAAIAVVVAWGATWLLRRRRPDHLEMALPEGIIVAGLTWAVWTALHHLTQSAFGDVPAGASWALMTGTFLLVFLGGWRWLYGYVRAHDSLTPKPVARRLAQQEQRQEQEGR